MWTFNPIFKTIIWGGDRIAPFKRIETTQKNIGESWEISGVDGSESVVADGPDAGMTLPELVAREGADLLGKNNFSRFGTVFPLLIKFIDARDNLSVQVHPDDALAQKRGKKFGKTEMWYVLGCDEDAHLANGFNRPVDPEEYASLVETGDIMDVLNFNQIQPGEVYFIPAGRVHAIGKGCFVAEIQQTSDITYRLYDYKRKDAEGKERELHTEEAFDAINFSDISGEAVVYEKPEEGIANVAETPYFTTNVLNCKSTLLRDYTSLDSFVAIICTKGEALLSDGISSKEVREGDTVLIPAVSTGLKITPSGSFEALETFIDQK